MPRLKTQYREEILPEITKKYDLKNAFEAPQITKITVNVGTGKRFRDANSFDKVKSILAVITGQQPIPVQAKTSVAQFKTREGMTIALKVTLRGDRMYEFLDRLISIALPRTRDFQGIPLTSIDQKGNVNFGIREQIIFPELTNDQLGINFGMQVNMTIEHSSKEQSEALLRSFGFPFKRN